ncbi:MAG: division/cell wall cluster transcriptional repressor MraZ [Planctomycetia bacterium]|nr:division/cell wall cluster transcriptional repressor MraZ [Planctomycetia bacterium]
MAAAADLLIGEFVRTLDERFRLAIPQELLDPLLAAGPKLVLAKERAGCLSLWSAALWKPRMDAAVDVVRSKMEAGLLAQRVGQLQELGRLLSTRHQTVSLAGRARLVVPEGFREFLGVEPGGSLLVVGAAVCVELWQPAAWTAYVTSEMPGFRRRIDELTA